MPNDKPAVSESGILGNNPHPADEHLESLQRAMDYVRATKKITGEKMRLLAPIDAAQSEIISDAVPRGGR